MRHRISTGEAALAAAVLIHFGVSAVHGFAHTRANVTLPPAAMAFVFTVILAGPIVGLLARIVVPRAGAWVIAATLGAALVFGVANHFLIPGVDHVLHVARPWRVLFGATAALLVLTEAFGAGVAVWCAMRLRR